MTANLARLLTARPFGFIQTEELAAIIAEDRLTPLLVRCGGCRFTCPAQDVPHLLYCIGAGGDYVRDISSPSPILQEARSTLHRHTGPDFNDTDCGGTFDGFQVTSDADPGL